MSFRRSFFPLFMSELSKLSLYFFPSGFAPGMDPTSSHQQQFGNGSIQISPIAPTLQPSSVPFYLQQDLEALRRVSEQYPSPAVSQQTSPRNGVQRTSPESAAQSLSQRPRRNRADRSSRKLSLDPYTKLKVEKLEVVSALVFLFVCSPFLSCNILNPN